MLDAKDITNVCGVISRKDVLREISNSMLINILQNPEKYLFRNLYILVEESFGDESKDEDFEEVKFTESKYYIYYVNKNGNIYNIAKKTKKRKELTKFLRHGYAHVKANKQDYRIKNLVAQTFIPGTDKYDVVLQKNNNVFDCSLENLIVINQSQYKKFTGAMSRSQEVGLFENGKLVRKWSSARKCAKSLFCSYQTIMDICNKKTKRPMYDVRWLKNGR